MSFIPTPPIINCCAKSTAFKIPKYLTLTGKMKNSKTSWLGYIDAKAKNKVKFINTPVAGLPPIKDTIMVAIIPTK